MNTTQRITRWLGAAACALALASSGAFAQGAQPPIRIGSTLALTGPLAATGLVHKVVGEIYVEQLNKRGGLLGRQVEWIVKDDQSKPDLARTLYEQLVTTDKVDLLMGPYATGAILSAMGVAQRYNKVLVHHTFGIPSMAKYEGQFPAWSLGPDPANTVPNTVFNALAASPKPPKTIAIVTSKFPSVHFMSLGAREVAKKRGLNEVLFLEWDFGNLDYAPIAARIKDAKPDFVWVGAIGLEGNQLLEAMNKIDYVPQEHFYMYPGARTDVEVAAREERAVDDGVRGASAVHQCRRARRSSSISITSARRRRAFPTPTSRCRPRRRTRRGRSSKPASRGANSLDDAKIIAYLRANKIDTIQGKLRFDGPSNYGDDLMRVKQVQDGRWVTVLPKEYAAPGATLQVQ